MTTKIAVIAAAALSMFAALVYELDKRSEHSVQKIYEQAAPSNVQD